MIINIKKLCCKKCGHKWMPRQEDVRMCPKCKSVRWDREQSKKLFKKII